MITIIVLLIYYMTHVVITLTTGYLIYYTTDSSLGDSEWVVEAIMGDRLSTTVKDLSLETTYYFKVQARNNIGYGPMSPTVIFRTPRCELEFINNNL